jgi:hypothetical protein
MRRLVVESGAFSCSLVVGWIRTNDLRVIKSALMELQSFS